MKKIIKVVLFFSFFSCFSQDRDGYQVMFTLENDSFVYLFLPNNDEHYTGGAKVEIYTPEIKKWIPFLKLKNTERSRNTFGLTVTAYTPFDLSEGIKYGDRPYASFTAFSLGKESYGSDFFLKSEIYLGFMGFDLAKGAQTSLHAAGTLGTERIEPEGWHNQIGDKQNPFVFNYAVNYLKQINSSKRYMLAYRLDTNLGNYMTDFGFGLNLAWNINTTPFLPTSIPVKLNEKKDAKSRDLVKSKKKWFRMTAFLEPKLRHVLYNSTLEGTLFNDSSVYTIPHSDIRRYQFELRGGLNLILWDAAYLGFIVNGRSQEFKGAKQVHYWGSLSFGFRWE